jgi:hypothetical protein
MAGMTGRVAALSALLFALAATPANAQEADGSGRARETCAEVRLDGDFQLKIPCPPGTRELLKQLPRPAESAPRRDIVIDPKWPHDQAMIAEHDWPHDWAMVVPQTEPEEEAVPLLDDLLGLVKPYLSNDQTEDGGLGSWSLENGLEQTTE